MDQPPAEVLDPRAALRRRWLAHAAAAFDLMFHPDPPPDLVSFDQREARALALGGDLTAWLLQQHANQDALPAPYAEAAPVATVMVDGRRYQQRAVDAGPGVAEAGWREVKVACCQTLAAPRRAVDPQPEPPATFLDPVQAARLAAAIQSRGGPASARARPTAAASLRRSKANTLSGAD